MIRGNFAYIEKHPWDNWEAEAFRRADDGLYYCGIGRSSIPFKYLHVVFVAMDPATDRRERQVVGLYARARVDSQREWAFAKTRNALLIVFARLAGDRARA